MDHATSHRLSQLVWDPSGFARSFENSVENPAAAAAIVILFVVCAGPGDPANKRNDDRDGSEHHGSDALASATGTATRLTRPNDEIRGEYSHDERCEHV